MTKTYIGAPMTTTGNAHSNMKTEGALAHFVNESEKDTTLLSFSHQLDLSSITEKRKEKTAGNCNSWYIASAST